MASLESRSERLDARETICKYKPLHNRQPTRDDLNVLLASRESSRVQIVAVYADLTD